MRKGEGEERRGRRGRRGNGKSKRQVKSGRLFAYFKRIDCEFWACPGSW
jgi:hypothetical protein